MSIRANPNQNDAAEFGPLLHDLAPRHVCRYVSTQTGDSALRGRRMEAHGSRELYRILQPGTRALSVLITMYGSHATRQPKLLNRQFRLQCADRGRTDGIHMFIGLGSSAPASKPSCCERIYLQRLHNGEFLLPAIPCRMPFPIRHETRFCRQTPTGLWKTAVSRQFYLRNLTATESWRRSPAVRAAARYPSRRRALRSVARSQSSAACSG